jgi:hypothetical protein
MRNRREAIMVAVRQLAGIALGLAVAVTVVTPSVAQRGKVTTAARAKALRECSIAADRFIQHTWGDFEIDVYRACMARHGQPE